MYHLLFTIFVIVYFKFQQFVLLIIQEKGSEDKLKKKTFIHCLNV